jgi:hypothetical protein
MLSHEINIALNQIIDNEEFVLDDKQLQSFDNSHTFYKQILYYLYQKQNKIDSYDLKLIKNILFKIIQSYNLDINKFEKFIIEHDDDNNDENITTAISIINDDNSKEEKKCYICNLSTWNNAIIPLFKQNNNYICPNCFFLEQTK